MLQKMRTIFIVLAMLFSVANFIVSAQDAVTDSVKNAKILDEVTVESQSIVRTKDYVLIRPTKNERSHATNAMEMLGNVMLPGVDVSNSGISVFSQAAGIFLDGAQVNADDILKIRPQDIAKVEFIDNPKGKYAHYPYAFNFVLKKQDTGGYVLGKGEETFGFQNRNYELAVSMNHKNSTFSVFGGTKYNNHGYDTEEFEETYRLIDGTVARSGSREIRSRESTHYGQLNFRNATDKHFIQAKASLYYNGGPRINETGEASDNGALSAFSSSSSARSLAPTIDLSANFNLPKGQSLSFTAQGKYSRNHYNRLYSEGAFNTLSDQKEDSYSMYVSIDYSKSLKIGTLTLDVIHSQNYWNTDETGSYLLTQKLRQNETLVLAGFNAPLGKGWRTTLRIGIDELHHNNDGTNSYTNVSPRGHIGFSRTMGQKQLFLNFGWNSSSYPSAYLSETEVAVNPWLTSRGNPDLRKQHDITISPNYSFPLGKVNIWVNPYYTHYFRNANYDYLQADDHLIRTFRACDYDKATVQAGAMWSKGQTLKTNFSASYSYILSHGFLHRNLNVVDVRGSLNWYVGNFRFSPSVGWRSRDLYMRSGATQRSSMKYALTVSYGWKNLYVGLQTSSPFSKKKTYSDYTSEFFDSKTVSSNRMDSRYLTLTVQYSLDFGRKTQHDYHYVEGGPESSINRL